MHPVSGLFRGKRCPVSELLEGEWVQGEGGRRGGGLLKGFLVASRGKQRAIWLGGVLKGFLGASRAQIVRGLVLAGLVEPDVQFGCECGKTKRNPNRASFGLGGF